VSGEPRTQWAKDYPHIFDKRDIQIAENQSGSAKRVSDVAARVAKAARPIRLGSFAWEVNDSTQVSGGVQITHKL